MNCTSYTTNNNNHFEALNQNCFCSAKKAGSKFNYFFSESAIFLSKGILNNLKNDVELIENEIRSKENKYTGGVFMSYDFHLAENNLKLIEINTNAGGLFINYEMIKNGESCCKNTKLQNIENFKETIVNSFNILISSFMLSLVS